MYLIHLKEVLLNEISEGSGLTLTNNEIKNIKVVRSLENREIF